MKPKSSNPAGESREVLIENAIIANPGQLGFPGALAIRRCRVAEPCGLIDLMLLPRTGPIRLVLIEAKSSTAPDSASKVVGQLLMYYGGALMLGSDGLDRLRDFAARHREVATGTTKISPKGLTGGVTPPSKAWEALYSGSRLKPDEIQLFIGLDGKPHRAFEPTLQALSQHGLNIGYCIARNGRLVVVKAAVTQSVSSGAWAAGAERLSLPNYKSTRRAHKSDWQTKKLPSKRAIIPLSRTFAPDEMERIQAGLVPKEMEDKWFVYWEGNSLFFHRSWTGVCIYVVHFVEEGGCVRMWQAFLNRNPHQYNESSDTKDADMISYLIDVLLLKQDAVFPGDDGDTVAAAVAQWSQVGGAMMGRCHSQDKDVRPNLAADSR